MKLVLRVTFILSAALYFVSAKELPPQFKLCKNDDPDILKCILQGIQTGIVEASKGVPDLGLDPIDPLKIDSFVIGNSNAQIGLNQSYKDMRISGLRNAKIVDLKGSLDECRLLGKVEIPQIQLLADYKIVGKVLIFPVNGDGKANITMIDIPANILVKCERFQKDSETYAKFTKIEFRLHPKNALLHFTNLFNGNPEISANLNQFINENWRDIFDELLPGYEKSMGDKILIVANKFVDGIPYNKLIL